MLRVSELTAGYGQGTVLRGVNLTMAAGETLAIVGDSGSGKTTLLRAIFQIIRPLAGEIHYGGTRLNGLKTWQLAKLGLALVPEGRRLFPDHTVLENLQLGGLSVIKVEGRRAFSRELDRVLELFPFIGGRLAEKAAHLSGGEQQMVAIARALVGKPKLLCLDEPSLGLSRLVVTSLADTLLALESLGYSVLLTEQREAFAKSVSTRMLEIKARQLMPA